MNATGHMQIDDARLAGVFNIGSAILERRP